MNDHRRAVLRAGAAVAALATTLLAASLPAQRVLSSIDLSGTKIRYDDSVNATGVSIAPAFRADWQRATLNGSLELSHLGNSTSMQGSIAPSIFTPSYGMFAAELAGSLGGSTHQDGTHTGQTLAIVRGYAMGSNAGVWAGGGVGGTSDGSTWRPMRQGEIGGWVTNNGLSALGTVTPIVVADSIRYTDVQAALRYPTGPLELGVSVGTRAGDVGRAIGGTSRAWGNVSVVAWLSQTAAIVANGGSYPVDFTQGYPGGKFITVGLRLASRGTRAATTTTASTEATTSAPAVEPSATATTTFDMRSAGGGRHTFRIAAPGASSVEIAGDFTQWQPVSLVRGADGAWTVTRAIAPGTYQLNMRVNGGPWMAPPGLLTTRDEFGAQAGVITIR